METDKVTVEVPVEVPEVPEVPLKDQKACVFGSMSSMTNEQFLGSVLEVVDKELGKAKEWTPTEKDREELTKMMKGFQNPLMAEMVGPNNLPQLQNLQNFFANSLEKINNTVPTDASDASNACDSSDEEK